MTLNAYLGAVKYDERIFANDFKRPINLATSHIIDDKISMYNYQIINVPYLTIGRSLSVMF